MTHSGLDCLVLLFHPGKCGSFFFVLMFWDLTMLMVT